MCQGLNSLYFHIIGDGHQPNSRGLYTHYKDSLLKGGMTTPNTRSLDPGTYELLRKVDIYIYIYFFKQPVRKKIHDRCNNWQGT